MQGDSVANQNNFEEERTDAIGSGFRAPMQGSRPLEP